MALDFNNIIKKVKDAMIEEKVDLSKDEDLSLAVMNLISLEEHFFFSAEKTKKEEYFDLLEEIRETRKEMMKKLLPKTEGESWCISKHLLSASMRLIEVGTKLQSDGKKEEAKDAFDRAYKMYSIFWALKLKIVNMDDIKGMANEDKPWTLEDIVSKMVDCCDE